MFYNLLLNILLFLSRFTRKKKFVEKRLNQSIDLNSGEYCWVHCSSVGEVNLSETLLRQFLDKTDYNVLLSVMTDTGYETAQKKYKNDERVSLIYFPLDKVGVIKSILTKIKLKKLVLVETEIWPNLIKLASKQANVFIVNGRISDKSFGSYMKLRPLLKSLLNKIDGFIMQTDEDASRIEALGAAEEKISNFGNMKFDIELPDFSLEVLDALKVEHKIEKRKIFTAGSTRDDEEEYILDVFDKLEGYFMYLVPRHIERCPDIEERLLRGKYEYVKLTELESGIKKISNTTQILLVDKIGVLRKFYAVCDIAFVGGTFVNIGGHSLLEPLYYEKFPIFGQYTQNVTEIAKEIIKREIGFKVKNTLEFNIAIKELEQEHLSKDEIKKFFNENSNSAVKTFEKIIQK